MGGGGAEGGPCAVSPSLSDVAAATVGFVAADLAALLREATLLRLRLGSRLGSPLQKEDARAGARAGALAGQGVTQSGVRSALTSALTAGKQPPGPPCDAACTLEGCLLRSVKGVGASQLRHRWVSRPQTLWAHIGGYEPAKRKLRQCLEWPRQHAALFKAMRLHAPRGVLLHGPPGCAKVNRPSQGHPSFHTCPALFTWSPCWCCCCCWLLLLLLFLLVLE